MKGAGLILVGLSLAACGPTVTNFNPQPVAVSVDEIPGAYTVAIVGELSEPIKAQVMTNSASFWGYRQTDISSDMTVVVGEPLRRTVASAMQGALGDVTVINDEARARAVAKQGGKAVIITYTHGHAVATEREGKLQAESFVTVDLYGKATVVGVDGRDATRPLAGSGTSTHQGRDLDRDQTPVKIATETAITRFATSAASAVGILLAKPSGLAPVSDR